MLKEDIPICLEGTKALLYRKTIKNPLASFLRIAKDLTEIHFGSEEIGTEPNFDSLSVVSFDSIVPTPSRSSSFSSSPSGSPPPLPLDPPDLHLQPNSVCVINVQNIIAVASGFSTPAFISHAPSGQSPSSSFSTS